MMKRWRTLTTCAVMMALAQSACSANMPTSSNKAHGSGGAGVGQLPFVVFTPDIYVARAKTMLTGEVASAAEIASVKANPSAMEQLVESWQQSANYQQKLRLFLSQSFQQSNIVAANFDDQGAPIDQFSDSNSTTRLLGNFTEQMARTVMALDTAGQPLSAAMTTQSYMMTPPLMAYYAYVDRIAWSDTGSFTNSNPNGMLQSVFGNFTAADFGAWKNVSIRQPNSGETPTDPADTATLRSATTLVLGTPRMGFWTTPAFFAGWQTNTSNQARVTMNQALIVALGHAFDGTQVTQPPSLAALNQGHAAPSTPCYTCHLNLDPMRQIYRQAYTLHFTPQTDPNQKSMAGQFGFAGVAQSLTSVTDFGTQLASHPAFAPAWVQKVCTWANDAACLTTDSEFIRLTQSFQASGSLSSLVREVFSSPITTYATPTNSGRVTQSNLPVAKLDHLCPLLATRLGLTDPCGIAIGAQPQGDFATIQQIARVLPANNYARGQVAPVEANDPTLFFRSASENICSLLAGQLVDGQTTGPGYKSSDPQSAISLMVTGLMGISDEHAQDFVTLLENHYQSALLAQSGNTATTPTTALRSTFTAACLSPAVMGLGMVL